MATSYDHHHHRHDEDHDQLVTRLATGFGAMLEQVQQLAKKNMELEQQLAHLREEARHLSPSNGPLSALDFRDRLLEEQDGDTEPKHRPSGSESGDKRTSMRTEDQENAKAIADGVEAWKALTDGKGPLWRRHKANVLHERQTRDSRDSSPKQNAPPTGHPAVNQSTGGDMGCPFAALSHIGEENPKIDRAVIQRPDSLPTPPHTQEHFPDVPHKDNHEDIHDGHYSPPPSVSGSIYKCPIRMLDERSPEEIAKFFENHKHEIPRSHEICVRRYQSNSQTIRELDAKYGTLANMIKGLGMKHQPLLPSKEDDEEDDPALDTKSMRKVENWAQHVDADNEGVEMPYDTKTHLSGFDDRQGHFDRRLKEIRVGESPSRPWGIPVPPAAVPHLNIGKSASTPTPKGARTKAGNGSNGDKTGIATGHRTDEHDDDRPRMLFTGPVFIGYGPEQASAFIKEHALKA